MAKDKEPFESLAGIEQEVQITELTKHAMENYFSWTPCRGLHGVTLI